MWLREKRTSKYYPFRFINTTLSNYYLHANQNCYPNKHSVASAMNTARQHQFKWMIYRSKLYWCRYYTCLVKWFSIMRCLSVHVCAGSSVPQGRSHSSWGQGGVLLFGSSSFVFYCSSSFAISWSKWITFLGCPLAHRKASEEQNTQLTLLDH